MKICILNGNPGSIRNGLDRYLKELGAALEAEKHSVVQFTLKDLTIIKGGVEGIQVQPPKMKAKLFTRFYELGRIFGRDGSFDKSLIEQLAKPERLSRGVLLLLKLLIPTGLLNFYWNRQLKKNGAYSRRFAAPYLDK